VIPLTSSPSVASPGAGRLNIFARGDDGHLWGIWFAGGWGSWGDDGCCLSNGVTNPVAAVAQGDLTIDVFVTGTQHDLYRKHWDGSTWSDWQYLDHALDYTNIATMVWVPTRPPPTQIPDPPTATPSPNCGRAGQPPCILPK
jgi:hypothetical protein